MTRLKKAFFTFGLVTLLASTVCHTAFATCWVGCAAICRYTCQFELSGTCSDAEAFAKISACCNAAFNNTPGIRDVPCTESGPEG